MGVEDQLARTEAQTAKNTDAIQSLALNVTRIAAMVENNEKRHDSTIELIKESVNSMDGLKERMGEALAMGKDIIALQIEARTTRHDLAGMQQAVSGIAVLGEKLEAAKESFGKDMSDVTSSIATHTAQLNAINARNERIDGAGSFIKNFAAVFWTIFGGAILWGGWILLQYIVIHTGGGVISDGG